MLTETIAYVCKNPPSNTDIVKKLEKERKIKYKNEMLEAKLVAEREAAEKQKRDLEERQNNMSKPVGKPRMQRSQKPNLK